jgi:voltage-gated potassium channel
LFIAVLVLEFGSLTILHVEKSAPEASITTASDALWYVMVTMSTVGYGDVFPVSTAGREIGTFIIVVGVGIFGTLSGYLANLFLAPRKEPPAAAVVFTDEDTRQQLQHLKELLEQQRVAVEQLERGVGETRH